MKARDRVATMALRTGMAAIANAEAPPAQPDVAPGRTRRRPAGRARPPRAVGGRRRAHPAARDRRPRRTRSPPSRRTAGTTRSPRSRARSPCCAATSADGPGVSGPGSRFPTGVHGYRFDTSDTLLLSAPRSRLPWLLRSIRHGDPAQRRRDDTRPCGGDRAGRALLPAARHARRGGSRRPPGHRDGRPARGRQRPPARCRVG